MKARETTDKKIRRLTKLSEKMDKLPKLSPVEERVAEGERRFEATYHSNRLEGNKLTKAEARKAILAE